MKLSYSSNNSGGSWWLSDSDWHALEAAGWNIDWYATRDDRFTNDYIKYGEKPNYDRYPEGKFLGALASKASKEVASKDEAMEAVEEFERLTNSNASDEGCNCCGPPHSFSLYEEIECDRCDDPRNMFWGEERNDPNYCGWCEGTGRRDDYVAGFNVRRSVTERYWD
jgi:hypothetical protein